MFQFIYRIRDQRYFYEASIGSVPTIFFFIFVDEICLLINRVSAYYIAVKNGSKTNLNVSRVHKV